MYVMGDGPQVRQSNSTEYSARVCTARICHTRMALPAAAGRDGTGRPDGRVRAKVASSAAKDSLAAVPKEEVAALLKGDLRLAKPAFLRRLLDGTVSCLITDRR